MSPKNKVTRPNTPAIRFVLKPATAEPFRSGLETDFEQLKARLLAEALAAARPEFNAPLRRAANEAAGLAWISRHPLLLFPALFEEKSRTALSHAERQTRIYANSRTFVAA